tara:strand:- start:531 stop:2357 length:1827 start_codon:yes stop_codon:yes gene_type:complete
MAEEISKGPVERALQVPPQERSQEDLDLIRGAIYCHPLTFLSSVKKAELREFEAAHGMSRNEFVRALQFLFVRTLKKQLVESDLKLLRIWLPLVVTENTSDWWSIQVWMIGRAFYLLRKERDWDLDEETWISNWIFKSVDIEEIESGSYESLNVIKNYLQLQHTKALELDKAGDEIVSIFNFLTHRIEGGTKYEGLVKGACEWLEKVVGNDDVPGDLMRRWAVSSLLDSIYEPLSTPQKQEPKPRNEELATRVSRTCEAWLERQVFSRNRSAWSHPDKALVLKWIVKNRTGEMLTYASRCLRGRGIAENSPLRSWLGQEFEYDREGRRVENRRAQGELFYQEGLARFFKGDTEGNEIQNANINSAIGYLKTCINSAVIDNTRDRSKGGERRKASHESFDGEPDSSPDGDLDSNLSPQEKISDERFEEGELRNTIELIFGKETLDSERQNEFSAIFSSEIDRRGFLDFVTSQYVRATVQEMSYDKTCDLARLLVDPEALEQKLAPRELEVIRAIKIDRSWAEIAEIVGVTRNTAIKTYERSKQKLFPISALAAEETTKAKKEEREERQKKWDERKKVQRKMEKNKNRGKWKVQTKIQYEALTGKKETPE